MQSCLSKEKTQLSYSPCVELRGWMRIYPRYFPILLFYRMFCRTRVFVKFRIFLLHSIFVFLISFYDKYVYRYLWNFSVNSQENLFAFPKHTCTKKLQRLRAANLNPPTSNELEICLYWTGWFKYSWFKNIKAVLSQPQVTFHSPHWKFISHPRTQMKPHLKVYAPWKRLYLCCMYLEELGKIFQTILHWERNLWWHY